ncbi:MAG: ABC transporter ATP-binding protein/permease [Vicinamibacteraceae bacterium]|nr:ABC transporter ATP-binding protein/permease [Vicinamibacteraceae bacterium]
MRRLLGYLRPYTAWALAALLAIIVHSGLQLVQPWLTKTVIDDYIPARNLDGVALIGLTFVGVLVASFALEFLQTWLMQLMGQRIMFDMRMQIYEHLQRLSLSFYDKNPVGRLMTRVTSDVDVLNDLFSSGVVAVFGDVFTLAGIMIVLVTMDWRLALIAFSVLPLIVLVTQWFRRHVRDLYREVRAWVARINAFLQENITGMATVQLFRREAINFARFEDINARHRDANLRSIFYYAIFYPAIELVSALAAALIIWFGGGWVGEGTLTLGALVAFLQYSQRFFRPISDLSEKFNMLQAAMASSERIFKLLDTPATVTAPPSPRPLPDNARGHIVFDHVWFAYHGEDWVLRDVSFEVQPGERVGIVGATGAGKSTIIGLILRFYEVTRGRILVDGVDVREMDPVELRRLFGLVLQDVHLFTGTIASNIRLGNGDISDEAVRRAAAAVHALPFIERLPQGFATPVAERGATLSVGQRQLLSFARALAFDPRVLMLDEATSSVDTDTEILIRDALHVLMEGRTTIAIAHRLSTIQDMDQILVMHRGCLRERGTHQELLAARGIYFKLYQLQYKDQESAGTPMSSPAIQASPS